jgi:hypothetical protein
MSAMAHRMLLGRLPVGKAATQKLACREGRFAAAALSFKTLDATYVRALVVALALDKAISQLQPAQDELEARRALLKADLARLEGELSRLTAVIIAGGGDLPTLAVEVKHRKERKAQMIRELEALRQLRGTRQIDVPWITRALLAKLDDWSGLAGRHIGEARQILTTLLDGRLVFTPRRDPEVTEYEFRGQISLGRLFSGIVLAKGVVAPTGLDRTCRIQVRDFIARR